MGTGPQPGAADLATHLDFAGERKPHWLVWGPTHCTDLGGLGNLLRTARARETEFQEAPASPLALSLKVLRETPRPAQHLIPASSEVSNFLPQAMKLSPWRFPTAL